MGQTTITEALAELKTIGKRIAKKRQFVGDYLVRQEQLKDPLEKDGGSPAAIQRALQAIADLEERQVDIRRAVASANSETKVTIKGVTRTIADWLVWRREVAPQRQGFLNQLRTSIQGVRDEARRKGLMTVAAEAAAKPGDVIVNIEEGRLAEQAEELEEILGRLDGELSLKNATTTVEV